ncbi:hypothetical protein AQJ46_32735 [Streptomyces canus]|uniref:Uncharacterized protein n=1 Tax=Streptomyces canus TaxID=58343 RepID=A0A101RUQ5_9ACTN|nr:MULTISPECIES: hypothetical protein [Streptomyces]KUN62087.1 hypothetical protein AQJ46_32735 [Streptomyces canus]MDI5909030.1 hypothetical protein [Streptomyces sp. 12257]
MFAQISRQRGIEPADVRDVCAAWRAFGEFCQVEVEPDYGKVELELTFAEDPARQEGERGSWQCRSALIVTAAQSWER